MYRYGLLIGMVGIISMQAGDDQPCKPNPADYRAARRPECPASPVGQTRRLVPDTNELLRERQQLGGTSTHPVVIHDSLEVEGVRTGVNFALHRLGLTDDVPREIRDEVVRHILQAHQVKRVTQGSTVPGVEELINPPNDLVEPLEGNEVHSDTKILVYVVKYLALHNDLKKAELNNQSKLLTLEQQRNNNMVGAARQSWRFSLLASTISVASFITTVVLALRKPA